MDTMKTAKHSMMALLMNCFEQIISKVIPESFPISFISIRPPFCVTIISLILSPIILNNSLLVYICY